MEKAIFSLKGYKFTKVVLNLEDLSDKLEIQFNPSGKYNENSGEFFLDFDFNAISKKNMNLIANIQCKAVFQFAKSQKIDTIPDFFYPNTIAILFPYIRAYISTVTLQANIRPLVLPTMNLSSLKDVLKNNTTLISR